MMVILLASLNQLDNMVLLLVGCMTHQLVECMVRCMAQMEFLECMNLKQLNHFEYCNC